MSNISVSFLQASKDELLQTPLENSLKWAEKGDFTNVSKSFMPSRAESLSFAALQPVASKLFDTDQNLHFFRFLQNMWSACFLC